MTNKSSKGLAWALARISVMVAFVVGVLIALLQVAFDFRHERDMSLLAVERLVTAARDTAAKAAFRLDVELAENVVNGLQAYDFVTYVDIRDDNGEILASSGVRPDEEPLQADAGAIGLGSNLRSLQYNLTDERGERIFGILGVAVDLDIALAGFYERIVFVFAGGLVRNLLLALLFFGLAYFMVARPLVRLSNQLMEVDPEGGRQKSQILIDDDTRDDEISALAVSMNRLLQRYHDELDKRREIEGELRVQTLQLEAKATQLAIAKEMANQANLSKSSFLAKVSHELRTPLNAIIGFSELMDRETFGAISNEHYKEYVHDIYGSGLHLQALVSDVLDISRVEVGEMKVALEDVDIAEVCRTCADAVGQVAGKKKILMQNKTSLSGVYMRADATRLRQIVDNLLTNAIKFTSEGGEVTLYSRLEESGDLLISIEDNGVGMSHDTLEQIFDPFVQGRMDWALAQEGAGIGLALVKSLTELHDGQLDVQSQLGEGSVFAVRFPATRIIASGDQGIGEQVTV